MLKEACVESFAAAVKMIGAGAGRIELNSDLGAGGTTPSFGLIKQTVEYAHHRHVPVVVMIRPRGGDFVYSDGEIAVMESDLQAASLLGADAVAFGCLTAAGQLDKRLMKRLLGLSQVLGLQAVMHMAFDAILPEDQHAALDWLSAHGVKRVLTHGGNLDQTIFATLVHLKTLVEWAGTRIEILPGGGITAANGEEIAARLGVAQLHGTKIVKGA